ncbi:MAG: cell wall-active antibiotics response protein LiaF [candidate division KSB1 bacterium]|nr:cell wall-active antibiotics response protein LiaF [candidate division KSB1 bacterium]MDZ7304416.1 cell wall-active antibiotics response protein LiaF [candidate division KSB1 bacterium]MDZ7313366.1 cell wall-active antibiotics response protein LiaF [candidate division KSB1 bacterium]
MSPNPLTSRRLFWGTMLILIGVLFLLDNLRVLDFEYVISRYWPLIIVLIGLRMILTRRTAEPVVIPGTEPGVGSTASAFSTDYLSESRFIGDINLQATSKAFQGGTASNFIGDINLDLSGITLAEGQRNLTISGFIGDVNLVAPKNVPYAITASVAAGDLVMFGRKEDGLGVNRSYKSPEYDSSITRLNIRISFFIGDIKIF